MPEPACLGLRASSNGKTEASQAYNEGSIPFARSTYFATPPGLAGFGAGGRARATRNRPQAAG